jgi:DNA-binding NarL/FixJ family response regulator
MGNNCLELTKAERTRCSVLIIEPDESDRSHLRACLKLLSFGYVSELAEYAAALKSLFERRFTHLLFATEDADLGPAEFCSSALKTDPDMIAIAMTRRPDIDEMFDLLLHGARGYVLKPFEVDDLQEVVAAATKGEPIPEEILKAPDKNEVLVNMLLNDLDKVARAMKITASSEAEKRKLPPLVGCLSRSVRHALIVGKGGEKGYMEVLERVLVERSMGPATRLGRLRKRLAEERNQQD